MELAALYTRAVAKAEQVVARFNVPRVYGDPEELLHEEQLDSIDIVTDIPTHASLVKLAARSKLPMICQRPMAPDYQIACEMVEACCSAGVPFMIHETFRWQRTQQFQIWDGQG